MRAAHPALLSCRRPTEVGEGVAHPAGLGSSGGYIVRNIVLRLGILAVIGIAVVILRPFIMGNAGDLKLGECFDDPGEVQSVEDVQHHPCTDPHTAEVVYVGTLTAAKDAPYPSDAQLQTMVGATCIPAFNVYTGLDFDTDTEWTMGYFTPHAEDWGNGDRSVVCYATRIDATATSTSIKGT